MLLTSEEYGEDMTSVNTLLNTHLDIVREVETLSEKVDKLEQDAENLCQTHPERSEEVGSYRLGGVFVVVSFRSAGTLINTAYTAVALCSETFTSLNCLCCLPFL